jgi:hypothetical protein
MTTYFAGFKGINPALVSRVNGFKIDPTQNPIDVFTPSLFGATIDTRNRNGAAGDMMTNLFVTEGDTWSYQTIGQKKNAYNEAIGGTLTASPSVMGTRTAETLKEYQTNLTTDIKEQIYFQNRMTLNQGAGGFPNVPSGYYQQLMGAIAGLLAKLGEHIAIGTGVGTQINGLGTHVGAGLSFVANGGNPNGGSPTKADITNAVRQLTDAHGMVGSDIMLRMVRGSGNQGQTSISIADALAIQTGVFVAGNGKGLRAATDGVNAIVNHYTLQDAAGTVDYGILNGIPTFRTDHIPNGISQGTSTNTTSLYFGTFPGVSIGGAALTGLLPIALMNATGNAGTFRIPFDLNAITMGIWSQDFIRFLQLILFSKGFDGRKQVDAARLDEIQYLFLSMNLVSMTPLVQLKGIVVT